MKIDDLFNSGDLAGYTAGGHGRSDGFSYNFRVIVPMECCGDRAALPHQVNLFDMHMKYADVVNLQEVLDYVAALQMR